VNGKKKVVTELLIKRKHVPVEEASWEEYWALVKRFSDFNLEAWLNLRRED